MHYLSVVDYAFQDNPSGSARVAWDHALAMRDLGHRVTLLCYHPDGPVAADSDSVDGIVVSRIRKPSVSTWDPLRYRKMAAAAAQVAARVLERSPIDIAHIHTQVLGNGVLDAIGGKTRVVTTVHSPIAMEQRVNERGRGLGTELRLAVAGRLLTRMEGRLLRNSSAVHTLSAYTRDQLVALHGTDIAEKVTVVPHWAKAPGRVIERASARSILGWPDESPALFSLRNHRPRYGIDIAIRALAPLLEKHDANFYIGGDGPYKAEYQQLSFGLDASDRIHFLGRMDDNSIELAYAAADMFILPTLALECFGLIVLEAYAHGCPIVSTDAAALPEVIGRVDPDAVIPAGDPGALRERVAAILDGRYAPESAEILRDKTFVAYDKGRIVTELRRLLEG